MAEKNASRLLLLRKELGISREKLARRTADVSSGTIKNAEFGKHRLTLDKAHQIITAVNALLSESGKQLVTMDELELRLY